MPGFASIAQRGKPRIDAKSVAFCCNLLPDAERWANWVRFSLRRTLGVFRCLAQRAAGDGGSSPLRDRLNQLVKERAWGSQPGPRVVGRPFEYYKNALKMFA